MPFPPPSAVPTPPLPQGPPVGLTPRFARVPDEPTGTPPRLAGFWIRLLSLLLDNLLYGFVAVPFVAAAIGLIIARNCYVIDDTYACYDEIQEPWSVVVAVVLFLLGLLVPLLLYVWAMGRSGQPWGARIVGIRVVRATDGGPIGFGRALGRTLFAQFISGSIFYLGYLWMLWDPQKQTWQDKVVGSYVVYT